MSSRRQIMKAAEDLDLRVISLTYSAPIMLEMGDALGGWWISTDRGSYAALNADCLIEYMRAHWSDD